MCRKTVILVMFFKRKKSSNHKIPSPSEKKKAETIGITREEEQILTFQFGLTQNYRSLLLLKSVESAFGSIVYLKAE